MPKITLTSGCDSNASAETSAADSLSPLPSTDSARTALSPSTDVMPSMNPSERAPWPKGRIPNDQNDSTPAQLLIDVICRPRLQSGTPSHSCLQRPASYTPSTGVDWQMIGTPAAATSAIFWDESSSFTGVKLVPISRH